MDMQIYFCFSYEEKMCNGVDIPSRHLGQSCSASGTLKKPLLYLGSEPSYIIRMKSKDMYCFFLLNNIFDCSVKNILLLI